MHSKLIIFLLSVFSFEALPAQNIATSNVVPTTGFFYLDYGGHRTEVKNYNEIEGNPYLAKGFEDCTVYFSNLEIGKGKLRYDMYADEMQYADGDKLFTIEKNGIDSIVFNAEKFVCQAYTTGNGPKHGYFILLQGGKYQLLLRKSVLFLAKVAPKPYTNPEPDRFKTNDDTYYLSHEGKPAFLLTDQKSLGKAFPGLAGRLGVFSMSEKIKCNRKADLLKLVLFMNTQ